MANNIIGVKNNNTILPYQAATRQSKWIDISAAVSGTNWSNTRAVARFRADSNNVWSMECNIDGQLSSQATVIDLVITGIAAKSSVDQTGSSHLWHNSAGHFPTARFIISNASTTNTSLYAATATPDNLTRAEFQFNVELNAEPTTYTTAANMEGVTAVDVWIAPVSSGVAGIFPATNAELDNVTATRLGLKQYLHGTTYNGGNAPTVTVSIGGALSSITFSSFIPRQMQDGSWVVSVKFYAAVTVGARVQQNFKVANMKIVNYHAISVTDTNINMWGYAQTSINDGEFVILHANTSVGSYIVCGEFKLYEKPTWAY